MTETREITGKKGSAGMTLDLEMIKEYIWAKYVENDDVEEDLEEADILAFLEDHYTKVPIDTAEDSFYYAILMFERAWEEPDNKEKYFWLARKVLLLYRERTGEKDWEAVEDRLADIEDFFQEEGLDPESLSGKYSLPAPKIEAARTQTQQEAAPDGMCYVPRAAVTIPLTGEKIEVDAFYIDRHPVTNAEFQRFLDATQYRAPKYWGEAGFKDSAQPTVGVSYFDAEKFAEWAGKAIPSHEQWLAAARGESTDPYPWGSENATERANCMTGETPVLAPVGFLPAGASPFGVQDLLGGVWEWTSTWFDTEKEYRIIKGGSYVDNPDHVSIDTLLYASPKEKIDNIGFRCCRPVLGSGRAGREA